MKFIYMFFALIAMTACGVNNQLQKFFFHKISDQNTKNSMSLEVCKLVFYFSKDPIVLPNKQAVAKNGVMTATYIFPKADITNEAQLMINKCNKEKGQFFSCSIKSIEKPIHGIELTVSYDPKHIDFQYDGFDAMSAQKAIVFTIYNKSLLEKLKELNTTILQTACNDKVPTIIIDCGHGGVDNGACGCFDTVEKKLTLDIGFQLAECVKKKGWNVILTRTADEFVSLDERTLIANNSNADLLISLHANFSKNEKAAGIETFYFDSSLLKPLSRYQVSNNSIIKNMSDNLRKLSNLLATSVHKELITAGKTKRSVIDRNVKQGAPQILLGAAIPSILVELGFISNQEEAKALLDPSYQNALIKGICNGLGQYLKQRVI